MSTQTTLLTAHKGVDLHAASALLVMKDRLEGGDRLVNLLRCELHTFWGEPQGVTVAKLLDTGRYFNPNKHHYGVFRTETASAPWFQGQDIRGKSLESGWPGQIVDTDLGDQDPAGMLYHRLLGGSPVDGHVAVDLVSFELGQQGPVLSGVLWRLVLAAHPAEAVDIGHRLALARSRKEGLLINPHLEAWLSVEMEQR
jgi:hypothetical protein